MQGFREWLEMLVKGVGIALVLGLTVGTLLGAFLMVLRLLWRLPTLIGG